MIQEIKSTEAFVYLWYDAPNKKYYLGKHRGSPDDEYTHSSTTWEHFTKDNIPEGVTRRILAYGTDEEMSDLETKLLKNRKERCWDRYYNVKWHIKAIGNLNDVLSEEGIKLWKERLSLASKGKPKPELSAKLKKFHASITAEERKKMYGHAGEAAWNWKGGISIGNNLHQWHKDNYDKRKELGMRLHNEGYSYYEIRTMYPKAMLPYHLIPREEKDRKNALAKDRYEHKRECYCRKSFCEYCNSFLLTPDEKKRRAAKSSKIRYERDKLDPIKNAHKREVARAWEEKNKEKRQRQRKEHNAKRPKKGPADVSGKKNPFYGKTHTPETRKKLSDAMKKRHDKKKAERQGVGTLEGLFA